MNKQYPEGRLVTEIVEKTSEMVVFKTSFYEDGSDVPKCTGHGSKQSNERDWLEKAEQKSRGRCLRVLLGSDFHRRDGGYCQVKKKRKQNKNKK